MTSSESLDLLRVHRSTRGLSAEVIAKIAEHVEVRRFDTEGVVHEPNSALEALVLVVHGRLRMSVDVPGGAEKTIMYHGRDEQFGLLALTQDDVFPVRVVAEEGTVILRIPRDAADRLVEEHPMWTRRLFRSLGPQLRRSLLGNKRQRRHRLVGLIHAGDASRHVTPVLTEQLSHYEETVGVMSDHDLALAVDVPHTSRLLDETGQVVDLKGVRDMLTEWSDADRIFVDISLKNCGERLLSLLKACDSTYWFFTTQTSDEVAETLGAIINQMSTLSQKMSVVRILHRDEPVAPLGPVTEEMYDGDFKLHWDGYGSQPTVRSQQSGLDRLVHHLRGVSVGLALGGGAARGMAHLGVLQVLERESITIDVMSGTSAGALTGILAAAGYSADFLIEAFARDLKPGWLYRLLPFGDAIYMVGKYRLGGWDAMLRRYLESWRLEQLSVPFSAVAVDLTAAETVVRSHGDAADAILESINLPGLARPICRNGQTLVDGGILNVVPADVVAERGANLVISSDVAAKIPFTFVGNTPATPTGEMKVPSTVSTMTRVRTVQDRNTRAIGGQSADIVIEPDVSKVELTDFKRAAKIAELGRTAAEAALPSIKAALHKLDPQLYPNR